MENSMEVPQKSKNRVAIWSRNPTPGCIPWQNYNLKRYMHLYVHIGTIYNSQHMEKTYIPLKNEWKKKLWDTHTHTHTYIYMTKNEMLTQKDMSLSKLHDSEGQGSQNVCVKLLQSWLTLCNPMHCSSPSSSVHGILQAWIHGLPWDCCGLPCPPPGDLLDPGIELSSFTSPSLAGGFCTTRATWEAP